ncbi:phage holin [Nocardia farcinica]|uniref:phage holin n=1 Tax=Nocardia farcinica TaxID=37329 RepID=UPI0024558E88|nr:hypothetical protein [Nocardia farcinica]
MSFDRIRDLTADVRGRIYATLGSVQVLLVTLGLLNDADAALWGGAVAALVGFTVAGVNSTATWRTWLYTLLGAAQPLLVAYSVATDAQASAVVAVVSAALGLGVAAAKTPSIG